MGGQSVKLGVGVSQWKGGVRVWSGDTGLGGGQGEGWSRGIRFFGALHTSLDRNAVYYSVCCLLLGLRVYNCNMKIPRYVCQESENLPILNDTFSL